MSWGVTPSVMLGHSIGEVTAAAVSGMLALPDAVTLVAARARAMQSVRAAGGMAAVALPADEVAPLVAGHQELALAAINAPEQCVVSGASAPLAGLVAELRERGVRVDELTVSHAFHSPLMAGVSREFARAISGLKFRQPGIPVISNVTGSLGRLADMGTPQYWARHIGEPVRFMDSIRAAEERGRHAFVEIGPSTALIALARNCVSDQGHAWVASARRRDPKDDAILRAIAELYSAGLTISWPGVHADTARRKTRLPDYPFERKRYWLPAGSAAAPAAEQDANVHSLLGREDRGTAGTEPRAFVAAYSADRPALLSGHITGAGPAVPSAAYVEILFALQDAVYGSTRGVIRDLRLHEPLGLPAEGRVELRTALVRVPGGIRVEMTSGPGEGQLHATAVVADPGDPFADENRADAAELRALAEAPGTVAEQSSGEDVYTDLASLGRRYGERYRLVTRVSRHSGGTVTAEVACRRAAAAEHLPPEVLECALHAVTALDDDGPGFLAVSLGRIRLFTKPRGPRLRVVARMTAAGDQERRADVMVLDGAVPVVMLLDVLLRRPERPDEQAPFLHRHAWLRHGPEPAPRAGGHRHLAVLGADPARVTGLAGPDVRVTCLAGAGGLAATLSDTAATEPVTDVCWLWRPHAAAMSVARMRAECAENYRDLLAVLGALRSVRAETPPRLWLITEQAQWLPGDHPGRGEQLPAATLWGFGRVLLNEDPRLKTTLLDLGAEADLAALVDECRAPATADFQIAYRDGRRFVRRLLAGQLTPGQDEDGAVPVPQAAVERAARPAPRKTAVRPDRTYLITGLGGLALATAHKLADLGATRIVLASRSGHPTPDASGTLSTLSARCEVTIRQVDLGDAGEVRRLVAEANPGAAPLGGVVHAAGLAGKSLIAGLTWEAIDEQLRAQAYGGWLLHETTQGLDLDFFVVHSSIATVIGGATQAHYAAAFAFLDALQDWRGRQGLPGIAVNWGLWARVGMSARLADNVAREIERSGILFFSPARALRTLHRLMLSEPAAQYVGGIMDWDRMASLSPVDNALYARVAVGRRSQPADRGGETAIDLTELASSPGPERLAAIGGVVRDSVVAAMQGDEEDGIDPTAEFVALGMDSLMAVELRSRLESAFRIPLPASLTFDYPSPQQLAEFIDRHFAHAGQ
jgi:acyl transferase domain-containing protein/acyl carrier protein